MRERIEGAGRADRAGDLDPHLPRRVRPDPAPRGRSGSATARTSRSTTRPTRSGSSSSASRSSTATRSASSPRGIHAPDLEREEPAVGPDEYAARVASFYDQTVADVYGLYQRRLFASNAVDFDDLLMLTVDVLERFPEARERWAKTFRYVLVDEYQDTNHAQYVLLKLLAGGHRNLMAVGDPDQSIYAFRGADIRNILEFERDFPGTRVIPLEQNYRSTNAILRAANARDRAQPRAEGEAPLVGARRGRARARDRGGGRARRGAVRRRRDRGARRARATRGSEIAVVYRTNAQSRVLEDVLVRQGIDYQVIGGPRFYERAEIKDAIAYLQVLDNPCRRGVAHADREPAAPRDRRHLARAPADVRRRRRRSRCGRRSAAPRRRASRRRRCARCSASTTLLQSLMARRARAVGRARSSSACSSGPGISRRSRRSGRSRRAGGSRTSRSSSASRASTRADGAEEPSLSQFLQEISLYSDQDALRRRRAPAR